MFFGDFDTTETVYIPFNTFDSNDPANSVTATTLAVTDVHVHKDGAIAQRTSTAGFTLSIDFDGVAGNHLLALDLSDNTHAGFWADGSQYAVRIEGATVDAGTINAWIGAFSIGRTLRPTTAGRTLDVTAGGAAGIDWGNVENPTTAVDLSATDIQLCDTVTTLTGHTAQTGDSFARLGAPAGASVSADVAAVKAETALIVADTNELQTDWVNGGRLDLILDTIAADVVNIDGAAMRGTDNVLTTTMTESYAADGAEPTLAQAVYLLLSYGMERSVSGTTVTAKKLDGTTTSATFTLNDATNPTSITRAS